MDEDDVADVQGGTKVVLLFKTISILFNYVKVVETDN
jgi:hypothetical protein